MPSTPTAEETASRRGRRWKLVARLVISGVLVAVLVSKIHLDKVFPRQHPLATLAWFTGGVMVAALGIVLSAWRWQRVLAVFDAPVPLRTLTSHYFAGQFVGNVLPSTIGGDVLRVSRASRSVGSGPVAFASVALERLTGFLVLPLICYLGFLLDPSLLSERRAWIALVISSVTLVALVAILVAAGAPKAAGRFTEHENWMRFIGAVHVGVDRLRRRRRAALDVVGATFVYQASTVLMVWFAVRTLGVSIPTAAVIAYAPAVAMAQVVPVSVGGFGVREGMLVLLLGPLGVPSGKAFGIGVAWYAMVLIASLLGAPAFALGYEQPAPHRPPAR